MLQPTSSKRPLQSIKLYKNSHLREHQHPKCLLKQARNFIAKIIDFDDGSVTPKQVAAIFLGHPLGKYQILQLWDQALSAELLKFTSRVNSVKRGGKNLCQMVLLKLQKCSQQVIEAIEQIVPKKEWCLCERKVCQSRMLPEVTQKRIQWFVLRNLNQNLAKEMMEQEKQTGGISSSFFTAINDEQCHIISLQKLSENYALLGRKKNLKPIREQEDVGSIINYLKNLRILDSERKQCYFDSYWHQVLAAKYSS